MEFIFNKVQSIKIRGKVFGREKTRESENIFYFVNTGGTIIMGGLKDCSRGKFSKNYALHSGL